MIQLLINQPAPSDDSTATFFGGSPALPSEVPWPTCQSRDGPMQFLGQLQIPDPATEQKLVLLFMCQNDPGTCDDWDADGGGNKAVVVSSANRFLAPVPDGENTLRNAAYGADLIEIDAADYDAARELWIEQSAQPGRNVLGQMLGEPSWIQGDEVPDCDCCGKPMRFAAQLEQGPDWQTEMNFGGGGSAYVFLCAKDGNTAKFLWQC